MRFIDRPDVSALADPPEIHVCCDKLHATQTDRAVLYLPVHWFLCMVLCTLAFFTITYYIGHLIAPGIVH